MLAGMNENCTCTESHHNFTDDEDDLPVTLSSSERMPQSQQTSPLRDTARGCIALIEPFSFSEACRCGNHARLYEYLLKNPFLLAVDDNAAVDALIAAGSNGHAASVILLCDYRVSRSAAQKAFEVVRNANQRQCAELLRTFQFHGCFWDGEPRIRMLRTYATTGNEQCVLEHLTAGSNPLNEANPFPLDNPVVPIFFWLQYYDQPEDLAQRMKSLLLLNNATYSESTQAVLIEAAKFLNKDIVLEEKKMLKVDPKPKTEPKKDNLISKASWVLVRPKMPWLTTNLTKKQPPNVIKPKELEKKTVAVKPNIRAAKSRYSGKWTIFRNIH